MKQKILIVDDSATARTLLSICFADYPEYEIIQESQWQKAVEQAQLCHPSIIFLDYNMPEKSGSELAQLMQQQGIKTNYVLVTANTQQSILEEVKRLGFFDVIEKPVSPKQIHSLLSKIK